jgi:uncharacterized protein
MKTLIINNLEFAQKQQKISDYFSLADCNRLLETQFLHDKNPQKTMIFFELSGTAQKFSFPSLHLHTKTQFSMICQRCLEEMQINLDLNFDYLISNDAENQLDDNDDIDWLEVNFEMNLLELIEDELLLALPYAPTHDNDCSKLSMQSGEKPNPFAILKGKIK